MKATEMRVGNYVTRESYDQGEKTFSQVHTVRGNDLADLEVDGYIDHNDERLEPIPLTEEWLIKLGFKRWNSKRKERTYSNGIVIIHERKNGYSLASRYVRYIYVHDLQNLCFALTGEELTL